MTLFRNRYRVESARMPGWDYTNEGWHYVTICAKHHIEYFGNVVDGQLRLSTIGEIAERCWIDIPQHVPNAGLDEFVVMPNHVHGIVIIHRRDVTCDVSTDDPKKPYNKFSAIAPRRGSLPAIIRSYKSAVTFECHHRGFNDFRWQGRYYDHIIRDEKDANRIRKYIRANPANWERKKNRADFMDWE